GQLRTVLTPQPGAGSVCQRQARPSPARRAPCTQGHTNQGRQERRIRRSDSPEPGQLSACLCAVRRRRSGQGEICRVRARFLCCTRQQNHPCCGPSGTGCAREGSAGQGRQQVRQEGLLGDTQEIDPRRAELAEKLTAPVTATLPAAVRVVARVGSCLDLTCAPVEGCEPPTLCVVDPSCSSSGVVGNPDKRFGAMFGETTDLAGLAEFQHSCLTHAMGLETVQAIVYSTCSVHDEENEEVVRRALQTVPGWKPAYPLSAWERRGHGDDEVARCSIRTDTEQDQTDGFYVCVLVRDIPEEDED
ncbi:RNA (C5-cytosine) methyltransferase, partial [Carpediemonas membranifera]